MHKMNGLCRGQSYKTFFELIYSLFCKLDKCINLNITFSVMRKEIALKRVSKFTQKKFHKNDTWLFC